VEFIGISERLLLVMGCFKGLDMAIFVMYFPTLDSDVEIKIALLEQISQRMDSLPVRYKGNILVLTDGNAHIISDLSTRAMQISEVLGVCLTKKQ
jgi:hypothetical protein